MFQLSIPVKHPCKLIISQDSGGWLGSVEQLVSSSFAPCGVSCSHSRCHRQQGAQWAWSVQEDLSWSRCLVTGSLSWIRTAWLLQFKSEEAEVATSLQAWAWEYQWHFCCVWWSKQVAGPAQIQGEGKETPLLDMKGGKHLLGEEEFVFLETKR